MFKCPHCDVISHSSPGLKGHISKKHTELKKLKGDTKSNKAAQNKKRNDKESKKEVSEVLELLLKDVIVIGENEIDSNVTVEEKSDDDMEIREYCNVCDECGYKITANKKYVALQLMLKNKYANHMKRCNDWPSIIWRCND